MGIVRVHRPELTPEERARRMEQLKKSAARVAAAAYKKERSRANEQHNHH